MAPELECSRARRFLRFPGGCYVEGDVLEGAFRWKQSIGPSDERPGHWNLWGYWSTDGALTLRCSHPTRDQVYKAEFLLCLSMKQPIPISMLAVESVL